MLERAVTGAVAGLAGTTALHVVIYANMADGVVIWALLAR
jgi:hypothetical protein